jgi:hypothetical protein
MFLFKLEPFWVFGGRLDKFLNSHIKRATLVCTQMFLAKASFKQDQIFGYRSSYHKISTVDLGSILKVLSRKFHFQFQYCVHYSNSAHLRLRPLCTAPTLRSRGRKCRRKLMCFHNVFFTRVFPLLLICNFLRGYEFPYA